MAPAEFDSPKFVGHASGEVKDSNNVTVLSDVGYRPTSVDQQMSFDLFERDGRSRAALTTLLPPRLRMPPSACTTLPAQQYQRNSRTDGQRARGARPVVLERPSCLRRGHTHIATRRPVVPIPGPRPEHVKTPL